MRDITRATTTKSPITSSVIVRATERDATVTAPVIVARALLAPTIRDTSGNTREIIGDLRTRAEPRPRAPMCCHVRRVAWTVGTQSNTTARVTCWSISAEISRHDVSHVLVIPFMNAHKSPKSVTDSNTDKQLAVVGEGTFGKVLECWDRDTREHVAVKVIRAVPKYRDAAMIEIRIFDQLHAIDPQHNSGIIHLKRWFDYCNHVCMVFPLCGTSLFDYMRNNQFQPLYLPVIRSIARQLFTSLAALHRHGIIHTDLKPENLLFRDTRMTPVNVEQRVQHEWGPVQSDTCQSPLTATQVLSPELVVVDFGSAVARTDHRSRVVGTRHYRAPEVMWEAHRTGNKVLCLTRVNRCLALTIAAETRQCHVGARSGRLGGGLHLDRAVDGRSIVPHASQPRSPAHDAARARGISESLDVA
jgi:hypothetical protein